MLRFKIGAWRTYRQSPAVDCYFYFQNPPNCRSQAVAKLLKAADAGSRCWFMAAG
jgi:hypothetical protein